ncbi:ABC transporter substrate-binding protein [Bradyrhizobium sp.]|uniref:ABC transporter substrate-binding protein n=1 Tax=Bradyrhizobium sp. TaxID=376 RepID=UPI001DB8971D|nr:ABC transporter substrate-binding protein [Bradyrhizobium sp.]MBI5318247.1 ABC transporter substrate-binding protein [Bradyrhizobium sp.]
MKRRDFMNLAAGAAVWPIAARALPARMTEIGFVTWGSPAIQMRAEDLRQGLRDYGYVEGRNIRLETHFTDGNKQRTREIIEALVAKPVDILVVWQTPAAHIAKEATKTIPIVIMVADALATGIVPSLSNPGGNITGVSNTGPELAGKRLELLREIRPQLRTVAFLGSSSDQNGPTFARETALAAEKIGMKSLTRLVDGPAAVDAALIEQMKRDGAEAIVAQPVFTSYRERIVAMALDAGLPVTSDFALFAEAGALFTLGVDDGIQLRRTAYYVDRILKGARPADLPIEQPTKFALVINTVTAKKLGWTVPPLVLARAERVIE